MPFHHRIKARDLIFPERNALSVLHQRASPKIWAKTCVIPGKDTDAKACHPAGHRHRLRSTLPDHMVIPICSVGLVRNAHDGLDRVCLSDNINCYFWMELVMEGTPNLKRGSLKTLQGCCTSLRKYFTPEEILPGTTLPRYRDVMETTSEALRIPLVLQGLAEKP